LAGVINIKTIELREIRLGLKEPFRISSGVVSERRILLLTLRDHDGVAAVSECVAGEYPNYSAETIDTAWHAIVNWIAPRVMHRALDHTAIYDLLETDIRGHDMAKAAVEMGFWSLVAERQQVSLSGLLGGTRIEVAVGISIGIQTAVGELVARARAAYELGYRVPFAKRYRTRI
jgi:o-succinylbenzoate synthase